MPHVEHYPLEQIFERVPGDGVMHTESIFNTAVQRSSGYPGIKTPSVPIIDCEVRDIRKGYNTMESGYFTIIVCKFTPLLVYLLQLIYIMRISKFFLSFLFFALSLIKLSAQADKDSLLKQNADDLIKELKLMYELDQSLRNYVEYSVFKSSSDSIDMSDIDTLSMKVQNEIWKTIINPNDSINTQKMITIIDQYGFPSIDRLEQLGGTDIDFNPIIILIHTPFSMVEKLIPIAEREFKNGNFKSKCEYGYLLWHLHGRSDFRYMLENGYIMETDEDGKFHLKNTCE
ncbi:hypothetical protein ED312_23050 [Sinomicrobium pectinilyticum]|uniref:Uncharacterized protein n=1 Tax=Sinomicrobium pectinilyticum TaxID=1084421 RepID=A0A3N0CYY9_SINP1|nr:hypothetical protein [Sinomicrobium pectinilyticum]RNL68632.1 hypothetical protein ED312_23050 [Sinomicrobium pectinilyticum]